MPRPLCCRRIAHPPTCAVFSPAGVPACDLEEVVISLDEYEAIRLADLEGLYQEVAAGRMNVSRQTFGRILEAARKKVATVLMEGKALRIEGGEVEISHGRMLKCGACRHTWELPLGESPPEGCPNCRSSLFRNEECESPNCTECTNNQRHAGTVRCCDRPIPRTSTSTNPNEKDKK